MARKKSVTLDDVARYVGFAKSTVAYVLRGKASDVGVAQETIEKIEAAAAELGYVPNYWASSLARRSSGMIAVLLSDLSADWADRVVSSLSRALLTKAYTPFLSADWCDSRILDKNVSAVIQRRDAGVICHSYVGNAEQYSRIIESGIPLVFLGEVPCCYSEVPGINFVSWNAREAVKPAVEHLVDIGRRKIAFIGVDDGMVSSRRRLEGFERAIAEGELPRKDEWLVWLEFGMPMPDMVQCIEQLFAPGGEKPDALFAMNDALAQGILQMLYKMGVKVPDDVALMSLGDLPSSEFYGISTMREPMDELGEAAARIIQELIEEPSKKPLQREITCNELKVRMSTVGDERSS